MRLIGCHVEGFGKLTDFDLTFDKGLNVIQQENGWGKTTLAAFIKAMLYGFDGKRIHDVLENERLRYKPWSGSKYGGYLDFEAEGREYRVFRRFGATKARDVTKVVDLATGAKLAGEIAECPGEWLFGLDANAFRKSAFIAQGQVGANVSILGLRNRLNALVNETDDVADLEGAQKVLEECRRKYKKTGNRGAIAECSEKLSRLLEARKKDSLRVEALASVQSELDLYSAQIADLEKKITDEESESAAFQAQAQKRKALLATGEQLRTSSEEARSVYDEALSGMGTLPTEEQLSRAGDLLASVTALSESLGALEERLSALNEERSAIDAAHPQLPNKAEIEERRRQLAVLAERQAAAGQPGDAPDEAWLRINEAISADAGLFGRAADVLAEKDSALERLDRISNLRVELSAERASWEERRGQIARLVEEARRSSEALAALGEVSSAREDARLLRSLESSAAVLASRRQDLEARLAASPEDIPEGLADEFEEAARAAEDAAAAGEAALRRATQASERAAALKEELERYAGEAKEPSRRSPLPLVLMAFGALAVALGVVQIVPEAMLPLCLVGVFLLAAGGVLLARSGASGAHDREPSQVEASYQIAADLATRESAEADHAQQAGKEAFDRLRLVAGRAFSGTELGSLADLPALRRRISVSREAARGRAGIEGDLSRVAAEAAELDARAKAVIEAYPGLPDELGRAAEALDEKYAEYSVARRQAEDATAALARSVEAEPGLDASDAASAEALSAYVSQRIASLESQLDGLSHEEARFEQGLDAILESLGLGATGPASVGSDIERLRSAIEDYSGKAEKYEGLLSRGAKDAAALEEAKSELDAWARRMGAGGISGLTDGWFQATTAALDDLERNSWERDTASSQAKEAEGQLDTAGAELKALLASLGCEGTPVDVGRLAEYARGEIARLKEGSRKVAALSEAARLAEKALSDWKAQNRDALAAPAEERDRNAESRLEQLRSQRDALVRSRARAIERREASLEELEGCLTTRQEIELLSKKRQEAMGSLFTVQKTSEFLDSARRALDGRYLGDLSLRFDEYANQWIGVEDTDASIDSDLVVGINEGGGLRTAAGYSAGYRDLLDLCLRISLLDTIYQAEAPFVIMDDPFANLDEEKMSRAYMLLESLSARYQIIYFTCHPSRAHATEGSSASFSLPAQRSQRELPQARARREAEERRAAQERLAASYVVVPVTRGRASVRPADARRVISSNFVRIALSPELSQGAADNAFEVYFVDEEGHTLCDRQTVQVTNGQVVPDSLSFSLVTREDSGSRFDLVAHEEGRPPEELAMREPFESRIAFATDLFA